MMKDNLKKHVITALFAALTFAATMAVRIPTPGTNGYIHPGDALVILSGVILGPSNGFLAAGIGSALADLLGGYFVYAPITFLIKGLVALCCGLIFQRTIALAGDAAHRIFGEFTNIVKHLLSEFIRSVSEKFCHDKYSFLRFSFLFQPG